MSNIYSQVSKVISDYNNIVFFGGAGVSTECGIPDFRSANGLYNKVNEYNYTPETILSHSFFEKNPDMFYEFLRNNILRYCNAAPNNGHRALTVLENMGKLKAIVTQNIDDLHQAAGSKNVLELHGTLARFYCSSCLSEYKQDHILNSAGVPKCECGGIIRPDIVLYEEPLDERVLMESIQFINNAEVLMVAGTSLAVYPAAGLLRYFKGKQMIFINKDKTDYDRYADIIINEPFAETMTGIMHEMGFWNKE